MSRDSIKVPCGYTYLVVCNIIPRFNIPTWVCITLIDYMKMEGKKTTLHNCITIFDIISLPFFKLLFYIILYGYFYHE